MKQLRLLAFAVAFIFCLTCRADIVSAVSVVVDDQVVTYGEIADKVTPLLDTAANVYAADRQRYEEEARTVRSQQVENLVQRKLVLHDFIKNGYVTNVLESFIDDKVKRYIQENYGGDRARFIQTLHAQGRTFEMYRRETKEDFIVNYMNYHNVDEPKKMLISPLRIEEYYTNHQDAYKIGDQVKVRMIVISQSADGAPGEARKMADEVLAKINSGVPFSEMANQYSSARSSDTNKDGGERGWVDRTYFKPELADAAFSLKPGQHTGVLDLPEGCYILLVEDVRKAHIKPLNDVRADVERTLRSQERARIRQQWIERLKDKSFIQYY